MYKVVLSRRAMKDVKKLTQSGLAEKAKFLIEVVSQNPFQAPPNFEKLSGDLQNYYSRRINMQHRFVYQVLPNTGNLLDETGAPYSGVIQVLRMWTHYE